MLDLALRLRSLFTSLHLVRLLVVEAPSDFADAMTEMTAEERSQGDAFGISHLGCDFFDALIARL